ncbi:MAG: OPT/YSL family transporter, partial [Verrucomicrobia bacterium]|nr:OPT/YSL family transporter [Verrucomicrobiota bacterium]
MKEYCIPKQKFVGTPEEIERQWYEQVYRGDSMKQLTVRAVVTGAVLGSILSITNLYIGLKSGWGFGVTLTACILSYTLWTAFQKMGWTKEPMTILENNCMQSAASSSGYSTGSTLVSAFAALVMIHGETMNTGLLLCWVFFMAVLGVTMAIPMKRQMINVEQLPFPTGTAAAETLNVLHSSGGEKGIRAGIALLAGAVVAAFSQFLMTGMDLIKEGMWNLEKLVTWVNNKLLPDVWQHRTVELSWDPIFLAAGAITGTRVSLSMLFGGTLCWCIFIPYIQSKGLVSETASYRELVQWSLWGGASCMVAAGILSFLLQWRSILNSFSSLGSLFSSKKKEESIIDKLEAPMSWFVIGQVVGFTALAILAHYTFGMAWWASALAVVMTFFLALVASRV